MPGSSPINSDVHGSFLIVHYIVSLLCSCSNFYFFFSLFDPLTTTTVSTRNNEPFIPINQPAAFAVWSLSNLLTNFVFLLLSLFCPSLSVSLFHLFRFFIAHLFSSFLFPFSLPFLSSSFLPFEPFHPLLPSTHPPPPFSCT